MGSRDKRVDAYIATAAAFARPVLIHIRKVVHEACPELEEQIKWGFPHFNYKGMMCSMASFKEHCALGFWKSSLLPDPDGILEKRGARTAMGQLGRITCLEDLPGDEVIIKYVRKAAVLNEEGRKRTARPAARVRKPVRSPAFFKAALAKHPDALREFAGFSSSQKREYVEWLAEAKTDATRQRRLNTAISWIAEGKTRNWKYMKRK